jgi:hypothetical protein
LVTVKTSGWRLARSCYMACCALLLHTSRQLDLFTRASPPISTTAPLTRHDVTKQNDGGEYARTLGLVARTIPLHRTWGTRATTPQTLYAGIGEHCRSDHSPPREENARHLSLVKGASSVSTTTVRPLCASHRRTQP